MNYLCKLTDVENDDAIVTNGFRKLIQQLQTTLAGNGPLIIVAAASRLHSLSEQVLSLFSYTLSIPVGMIGVFVRGVERFLERLSRWRFAKSGFATVC